MGPRGLSQREVNKQVRHCYPLPGKNHGTATLGPSFCSCSATSRELRNTDISGRYCVTVDECQRITSFSTASIRMNSSMAMTEM
jgi:hypothetical protein